MSKFLGVISALCIFCASSLGAGEQDTAGDKMFLVGLQVPVIQFTHDDDDNDALDFGLNPTAANLVFGFKPADPIWILARFGFNLHFDNGDNTRNDFILGAGARGDIPFDDFLGFGGLFLEYRYISLPEGTDISIHGIGIIPFGGIEYLATDYFSIGGQVQIGYLWTKGESSIRGDMTVSTETNGMILALLISASIYF